MIHDTTHLLFLSAEPPFRLCRVDGEGALLEEKDYSNLSDIALSAQDNLFVLLPGERVLLTTVHLPKVGRSEWNKVIPYELENELVSGINDCFFAFGNRDDANNIPVLVIEKAYFETCLHQLKEANLSPQIITPDFMLLPYEENAWVGYSYQRLLSIRAGLYAGFAVDKDIIPQFIALQEPQPKKIILMEGDSSDIKMDIPIEEKELHFNDDALINLLQGAYQKKASKFRVRPRWRLSVYAGIAVIVAFLLSYVAQYFYFHYHERQLEKKISLHYRQLFPNQTMPTDASPQVNALLEHLVRVAGSNDFMRLIKITGSTLKKYSNIELQSLNYRQPRLQITIKSAKLSVINAFILSLTNEGLGVQQTQKTEKTDEVIVKLNITQAGS